MFQRKMDTYSDHLDALGAQGIRYKPLVFSCFGRPHPESYDTLQVIAKQAARRHGVADYRSIFHRALAHITVQIWSRAAAMVHSCMPQNSPEELALLFGEQDGDTSDHDDSSSVEGSDADVADSAVVDVAVAEADEPVEPAIGTTVLRGQEMVF